ncbi:helix-turn-helix transcriptional regulator [Peterkaempfera bronchialis]|uniref:MarR family transcriptional regulator n=1 Tax=Peterkaempfera bronchialis TaxID=2126346 RepID=A0A345T1S9_9ACTN|nr:MarR family transcriptional regulator [Peterkaempfera bronchialis]AXI79934.1 MarR family transcriptional regulator [Peterkaempfera bronchialis]
MRAYPEQQEAAEPTAAAGVPAPGGEVALQGGHQATRDRVARSILDHGPSTAADLAERLGLTTAAVRRHLDALAATGLVESREQRVYGHRGRGRPAKVFALTDCGRDVFYQAYDQLAADALRWIAECAGGGEAGAEAVAAFARARLDRDAERYGAVVGQVAAEQRTEALARALSADGYAATVRRVSSAAKAAAGEQLCQHHCPVAHIAEQFPQLCEAETEVFSRLLGTHVQRLATIAHGDGVCTTHVPAAGAAPSPASRKRTSGAAPTAGTARRTPTPTTTETVSGRNPV